MYESQIASLFRHVGINIRCTCPTSPISFKPIFSKFNIRLKFTEFEETTSGMFIRSVKGNYIFINENHHLYRQRFSMGHEFGHFFLGHPSDVSILSPGSSDRTMEVEANRFAAQLLMPPDLMLRLHRTMDSIPNISEWLRVSAISAAIRFRELGLRTEESGMVMSDYWYRQGDAVFVDDEVAVTLT